MKKPVPSAVAVAERIHGPAEIDGAALRCGTVRLAAGRVLASTRAGALRRVGAAGPVALWPSARTDHYVLVSGLPRGGTSWLARITASLLRAAGVHLPPPTEPRTDDFPLNDPGDPEDLRLRAHVAAHGGGWHLAKTHYVGDLDRVRCLWIGRDLTDVMASTCHYALAGPAREHFAHLPPDEAYRQVVDATLPRTVAALRAIRSAPPHTLVLSYEQLSEDPAAQIRSIAEHLDLALPAGFDLAIARRHAFERESGRPRGQEDRSSYHRAGLVGDGSLPACVAQQIAEACQLVAGLSQGRNHLEPTS